MDTVSAAIARENPRTNKSKTAWLVPMREHLMGDVRLPLFMMLGAVVLVLGIGCANVASLLMARGMEREREFAIRAALGAGRVRLVRQLVVESLLLSSIAAIAGIGLAYWALQAIVALAPSGLLRLHDAAIDGRMLAFAAVLTTLTATAFGLIPAFQFSNPARDVMRERQSSGPRTTLRRGLVVAEIALALVLLTGAGLLIRSFARLMAVDPGFSRGERGRRPGVCLRPHRNTGTDAKLLQQHDRSDARDSWRPVRRDRFGDAVCDREHRHQDTARHRRSSRADDRRAAGDIHHRRQPGLFQGHDDPA